MAGRLGNRCKLRNISDRTGYCRKSLIRAIERCSAVRRPAAEGISIKLSLFSRRSYTAVDRGFTFCIFRRIVIDSIADKLNNVLEIEDGLFHKQTNLSSAAGT